MRTRSNEQDDYLLRIIRQAGLALQLLRARLTGSTEQAESIRRDIHDAIMQLLGNQHPLLAMVDAASAARFAGSQERVEMWAQLLELEADAYERNTDAESASACRARAAALRAAAGAEMPA